MFCKQCGAENADNAVFCKGCGAALTNADEQTAAPGQEPVQTDEKPRRRGQTLILIGAAAVVLVILLCILFGGKGYKTPVNKMLSGLNNADAKKVVSVLHKDILQEMMDQFDMDKDDFEDYLDDLNDNLQDMLDDLEDEYGDKIKISAKILDAEDLSKKDLKQLKEDYDVDYDLKVKDAKDLRIKLTIKGSEDSESEKVNLRVVKIGGSWYMDVSSMNSMRYFW